MPAKIQSTHTILDRQLILYRRGQSGAWQCRYKCDGRWQRASTKEIELKPATERAKRLMIEAEIRKASNLPVVTRKFRDIARLAVQRMQQELKGDTPKVSYNDYIRVIEEYLIPFLGSRNITNIDVAALDELDAYRIKTMTRVPSKSTMLTHNAALNRVFDEGKKRGFLTDVDRPTLESKGQDSKRRADFSMAEVRALIAGFYPWIDRARHASSEESRSLMRDYAMVLLDTGARPGVELLQLKWRQISVTTELTSKRLEGVDDEGEPIDALHLNRTVMMSVSGKNKSRDMVGMQRTGLAINNIAMRNYPDLKRPIEDPLKNIKAFAKDDFIFRKKDKSDPSPSFQKMFASYLEEHGLLLDPKTNQKRVFYSLRHTYATLALTHDEVPIHTLAKQMGTSVLMIEKHYSHLDVIKAIHQLRGNESRQLIEAGGVVDDAYRSNRA